MSERRRQRIFITCSFWRGEIYFNFTTILCKIIQNIQTILQKPNHKAHHFSLSFFLSLTRFLSYSFARALTRSLARQMKMFCAISTNPTTRTRTTHTQKMKKNRALFIFVKFCIQQNVWAFYWIFNCRQSSAKTTDKKVREKKRELEWCRKKKLYNSFIWLLRQKVIAVSWGYFNIKVHRPKQRRHTHTNAPDILYTINVSNKYTNGILLSFSVCHRKKGGS